MGEVTTPVRTRLAVAAIVALILLSPLLAEKAGADGGWVEATIADRAAAHGVSSWWLNALAGCESSGGRNLEGDFDVDGRPHSHGPFMLSDLPETGLLWDFYARGYTNPYSAWQSADYTAAVLAGEYRGVSIRRWSCWRWIGGW